MDGTKTGGYVITKEESERIDILKFIFRVMVLYIHSNSVLKLDIPERLRSIAFIISEIICRCAVPGYFFISAVLLYKREFDPLKNIAKKFKTLMAPYLFLITFWLLLIIAGQNLPILSFLRRGDGNILADWGLSEYLDAYLGYSGYPFLYTLWFLRDLFFMNLIAFPLKKIIDRFPALFFSFLLLAAFSYFDFSLFLYNNQTLVYFSLGYYFVKYDFHFSDLDKPGFSFLLAAYGVFTFLDFQISAINYMPLIRNITIILGFVFFYRVSGVLAGSRAKSSLLRLSRYSFPIYLFHERMMSIGKNYFIFKIFGSSFAVIRATYFIYPLFILFVCIAGSAFLQRYEPRLYGFLTGNRKRIYRQPVDEKIRGT